MSSTQLCFGRILAASIDPNRHCAFIPCQLTFHLSAPLFTLLMQCSLCPAGRFMTRLLCGTATPSTATRSTSLSLSTTQQWQGQGDSRPINEQITWANAFTHYPLNVVYRVNDLRTTINEFAQGRRRKPTNANLTQISALRRVRRLGTKFVRQY